MTEACKVRLENTITYSKRDHLNIHNAFYFTVNKECFNQNFYDIIYKISLMKQSKFVIHKYYTNKMITEFSILNSLSSMYRLL